MSSRLKLLLKIAGPNFDYGHGAYDAMNDGKKMKSITDFKRSGPSVLSADDNDHIMGPKEQGTSIYNWRNSPYQGTPGAKNKKKDNNNIDFPLDTQLEDQAEGWPILGDSESFEKPIALGPAINADDSIMPGEVGFGDFESYPYSAQIGGQGFPTPQNDQDNKSPDQLDFGRDYVEPSYEDRPPPSKDVVKKLQEKYLTPAETDLFGLPDGIDPNSDLDADQTINSENTQYQMPDEGRQMYEDKWNI